MQKSMLYKFKTMGIKKLKSWFFLLMLKTYLFWFWRRTASMRRSITSWTHSVIFLVPILQVMLFTRWQVSVQWWCGILQERVILDSHIFFKFFLAGQCFSQTNQHHNYFYKMCKVVFVNCVTENNVIILTFQCWAV